MSDKLLNVSQREAVETIKGPVLVIAGPGSGKTRVIEYRVLNLIEHGIKPESILLLTFTRRASAEMLNRAAEHDPRARKVEGGTFHSFAYKLLKQYGAQVGLPKNLIIMDEDDAQEAVGKIATRLGFSGGGEKVSAKGYAPEHHQRGIEQKPLDRGDIGKGIRPFITICRGYRAGQEELCGIQKRERLSGLR